MLKNKTTEKDRTPKRRNWFNGWHYDATSTWHRWTMQIVLLTISLLLTVPLFIMIYRYVPDLVIRIGHHDLRFDHILTAILVFVSIRLLLGLIDHWLLYVAILATGLFLISHSTGWFTYADMTHRYQDLISYVESNPVKIPFLRDEKMTIRNSRQIREAIDFRNPEVRNYAISISRANFSDPALYREYGNVVRYFSIFSEVVKWNYIPDPVGEEYYAKASESMLHLSGDCDDYSILMAACIKAVGGHVRLVHTKNHLYPEVRVCHARDFDKVMNLIKRKLYLKESLGATIYYRIDRDDYVWLNFDYTSRYPGGPFMAEAVLGMLVI